jgi:N-acetylneuraminic acid mutarotase
MPTVRAFFGVAVIDKKIYAVGGAGGANEVYDPATDAWTAKKPMLTPRTFFATATYQNKIYTIGGSDEGNSKYTGVNEVYEPETDAWETRTPMPTVRSQAGACTVDGKIYVIGGILEGGEILTVNEVYDPITDTWSTRSPIPYGVYSHNCVAVDNRIYVIAGHTNWTHSLLSPSTQIYEVATNTWKMGAPPSEAAHRAGAVSTNGINGQKKIYVIGGGVGFMQASNANQVYDPQNDSWSAGSPMPTARQGLGVAVVNDLIYAIGGSYPANGYATTSSSERDRHYTTLADTKTTPLNFVPQENCGVNEQYAPIADETPEPSDTPQSPTPSQSATPSPEPSLIPSQTPFSTTHIAIISLLTSAVVILGLLLYLQKRRKGLT